MKAYIEPNEVTLLENQAVSLRDKLLIHMLFHLGCRVTELISTAVDDVDLTNGTITIKHLKTRLRLTCPDCHTRLGRMHSYCPGCGKSIGGIVRQEQEYLRRRVLPIDENTLSMMREYISRGGPVEKNGRHLMFGINRHRAWQIVRECSEKAELPKLVNPETGKVHDVSPHRLRDAFAVHAMKTDDSGEGMRLLQEHLGHASFNTTARYRKIAGEEHKAWFDRLWR